MTDKPKSCAGIGRFLPRIGTPAYHLMLAGVAILILGPLGGISAAFMNFSIGFFIGGQVLAGILGSTVTLPYGPEGRHGANYMQTMAASVAGMCGMARFFLRTVQRILMDVASVTKRRHIPALS